jgi:glycolate oxidase FAD binding subunit
MPDLSAQLLEQVQQARSEGRRLRVCGARSKPWMQGRRAEDMSLAKHSGIVNYDPSELVVTVRAGTPLAELDAALAEAGQMLAPEVPDFNGNSTVGGAVALGWGGSRAPFAGQLRDTVLGVRMINGRGEDLRFGGQVMKNVAGFDVSRLMAGSLGRLGVLLELSLKVVPRPEQEMTLGFASPDLDSTRTMVDQWTRRGFPVSGACFEHGRFRVRFSGPGTLLEAVRSAVGGEAGGEDYWASLRRLELPLFHHGWGDEKLFDGNGAICWTAHSRQQGDGPAVALARGPDLAKATNGPLLARVIAAFDPEGLFQPALH